MKQAVKRKDEKKLLKESPITGRFAGWFFRQREQSAGCWVVEGTDEWGRQVHRQGIDPDLMLQECIMDAQQIATETQTR